MGSSSALQHYTVPGVRIQDSTAMASQSNTFNCLYPRPEAKLRVFCFPWAGGGSNVYAKWGSIAHKDIEVIGIRIPGREKRHSDPFAKNSTELGRELADEIIETYNDKPFALFGHSMGLSLAYETARIMREDHTFEPVHIFLSGSFAPHSEVRKKRLDVPKEEAWHLKSEEDLLAMVTRTGGTPSQVLENKDYMREIFLPVFRADLTMAFRYYRPDAIECPFQCGITFIDGEKDSDHFVKEIQQLTTGDFETVMLPGGHFYLIDSENTKTILTLFEKLL